MRIKTLFICIILVIIISGWLGVFDKISAQEPQPSLLLSESQLVFQGLVGETLQRTLTLSVDGGSILDLKLVVPDLIDSSTKRVILSDRISISPADISIMTGNVVITITITGLDRHGVYEGDILFNYPGMPENAEVKVHLIVNIDAVPLVDTDVNSKSLTLFVEPSLLDFPAGRPSATSNSPVLGEVVLSLIQAGDSLAIINNARVLAMQSSQGRTLPQEAVSVASSFPIPIEANDAATLRVVARGRNLPAGDYSGTLLVNVENQLTPIQIPLAVQVKDGPILAFVLLAIGPLIGILFLYWNKDGKRLIESRQRIKNLQRVLHTGRLLTLQDQEQIKIKLEGVMDTILNKADGTEVETRLVEIEDFIKVQQTSGEQYYLSLQKYKEQFEEIQIGQTLRDDCLQKITVLSQQLENGSASSWEAVQNQMDAMQTNLTEMQLVIQDFKEFNTDKQLVMLPRLNNARSIEEFRGVISEARDIIPKAIKEIFQPETPGEKPEWRKFNLVLQWRRIAVSGVVYIFTLFVGWITLYGSSPTFGANREDYITLFLWGVASNVVGGQGLDLKSIFTRQGDSDAQV